LQSRGLAGLAQSAALRFLGDCPHPTCRRLPAMVAAVHDADGELIAIHRTYLRPDGSGKAEIEPEKASLGRFAGGAIRIYPTATELLVAEGIESAAAAGRLLGLPAWAAISAGNLAKTMMLPSEVRAVVIAADNDLPDLKGRRPGHEAARDAATRWRAEGRQVRIALPDRIGSDFNDLLLERAAVAHG
jgi:phage/plasmid primase-like uncharacterized protein